VVNYYWDSNDNEPEYSVYQTRIGVFLHGSFDYYLSRTLSLQCRTRMHIMPGLIVPEKVCTYSAVDETNVSTLIEHTIPFISLEPAPGVGFHI